MDSINAEVCPIELPSGWQMLTRCSDGAAYMREDGLLAVVNTVRTSDQRSWLHVSCSTSFRPPTQFDLQDVKAIFIGPDRTAVHVLPPVVSGPRAGFCLHLWASLDDLPLPAFLESTGRRAG